MTMREKLRRREISVKHNHAIVDNLHVAGICRIAHFTCTNAAKRLSPQKNPMLECRRHRLCGRFTMPARLLCRPPAQCRRSPDPTTRPSQDL
ncbi:hypothetical protein PSEUDO8AS_60064 [Pseudomonas sp. 8AS]|nr:hypothetical protein PSEUDO8AS_60064 [Pseudomonas sp. 8AS]